MYIPTPGCCSGWSAVDKKAMSASVRRWEVVYELRCLASSIACASFSPSSCLSAVSAWVVEDVLAASAALPLLLLEYSVTLVSTALVYLSTGSRTSVAAFVIAVEMEVE